jgi:hypothetical protein
MKIIKSEFKLEIKSKINFYFIQCFGFFISAFFMFFNLIPPILDLNYQAFNINYFGNFCFFLLFFFLSVWFIFGYEKIIIDKREEKIKIIKSNYLFTFTKLVSIDKINRIACYEYKNSFFEEYRDYIRESQKAFFWIDMGKISVYTNIDKISILNGLSRTDCKIAFDEINEIINS